MKEEYKIHEPILMHTIMQGDKLYWKIEDNLWECKYYSEQSVLKEYYNLKGYVSNLRRAPDKDYLEEDTKLPQESENNGDESKVLLIFVLFVVFFACFLLVAHSENEKMKRRCIETNFKDKAKCYQYAPKGHYRKKGN